METVVKIKPNYSRSFLTAFVRMTEIEICSSGYIVYIIINRNTRIHKRNYMQEDNLKKYKAACILLAGGRGERMGTDIPKQFLAVGRKSVIEYTLSAVFEWKRMDTLIVVADEKWRKSVTELIQRVIPEKISFAGFADPGKNRQLSILNAMNELKPHMEEWSYVMIHDAVRPCVSADLIAGCDALLEKGCGVMPAIPVKDTIYESDGGACAQRILNRDLLFAGQTPEFFDFNRYFEANEALLPDRIMDIRGSSEPAILAGMRVKMAPGDEGNFKLTTIEDLERFKALV